MRTLEIVNRKRKYCYNNRVLMTSISLEELEGIKDELTGYKEKYDILKEDYVEKDFQKNILYKKNEKYKKTIDRFLDYLKKDTNKKIAKHSIRQVFERILQEDLSE